MFPKLIGLRPPPKKNCSFPWGRVPSDARQGLVRDMSNFLVGLTPHIHKTLQLLRWVTSPPQKLSLSLGVRLPFDARQGLVHAAPSTHCHRRRLPGRRHHHLDEWPHRRCTLATSVENIAAAITTLMNGRIAAVSLRLVLRISTASSSLSVWPPPSPPSQSSSSFR